MDLQNQKNALRSLILQSYRSLTNIIFPMWEDKLLEHQGELFASEWFF